MMKRAFLLLIVGLACSSKDPAGKATYDLVRYTPPAPWKQAAWKQDTVDNTLSYTSTDDSNTSYCQIFIFRSAASKGDSATDFDSEWNRLVVGSYKVTDAAQLTDPAQQDGWQVRAGVASFAYGGGTSIAMLTNISGYGRSVSIVAVTSSADYLPAIQTFLGSVEMIKPGDAPATDKPAAPPATDEAKPAALQGYMDYNPITKSWTWKLRYPPPP